MKWCYLREMRWVCWRVQESNRRLYRLSSGAEGMTSANFDTPFGRAECWYDVTPRMKFSGCIKWRRVFEALERIVIVGQLWLSPRGAFQSVTIYVTQSV